MFRKPTAFVLGAGASWHYGYPTGEGLVKLAVEQARRLSLFFDRSKSAQSLRLPRFVFAHQSDRYTQQIQDEWIKWENLAANLADRLEATNPTLIDFFLKQNADLRQVGKLVIAMVIFECERQSLLGRINPNHQRNHDRLVGLAQRSQGSKIDPSVFNDDWLRFVLHKLTVGCSSSEDLINNDVCFVTFNYDTSLEHRIRRGLESNSFFEQSHIDLFFHQTGRFLHVYGSVRRPEDRASVLDPTMPSDVRQSPHTARNAMETLNAIFDASQGLRTIDGDDKEKENNDLKIARNRIARSKRIYVLGYGFDEINSERLLLGDIFRGAGHELEVMFTNYGGQNKVSKSASRLVMGFPGAFMPPGEPIVRPPSNDFSRYFEISTKNVYDALEQDFESLELDGS